MKLKKNENQSQSTLQEDDEGSKPLSETLLDLQLNDEERRNLPDSGIQTNMACMTFYLYQLTDNVYSNL